MLDIIPEYPTDARYFISKVLEVDNKILMITYHDGYIISYNINTKVFQRLLDPDVRSSQPSSEIYNFFNNLKVHNILAIDNELAIQSQDYDNSHNVIRIWEITPEKFILKARVETKPSGVIEEFGGDIIKPYDMYKTILDTRIQLNTMLDLNIWKPQQLKCKIHYDVTAIREYSKYVLQRKGNPNYNIFFMLLFTGRFPQLSLPYEIYENISEFCFYFNEFEVTI
jgi:hypothetical protein